MREDGCAWDESGEEVVWTPCGPWTEERAFSKCLVPMDIRPLTASDTAFAFPDS